MVHSIATDIVMTNVLAAGWKGNHCLCPVGVLEVWWRHSKAWAGAGSIDWALVSVRTLHNQHQPSHHQVGPDSLLLTPYAYSFLLDPGASSHRLLQP